MIGQFSFWPELASSFAWKVDAVYIFIILVTGLVTLGVYAAVVAFVVKYKRKSDDEIPEQIEGHLPLEIAWSVIPLGLVLIMFGWGAKLFFDLSAPPAEALNFYVVGKQWMWKVQHPSGKREINELHLPLGQPVKLTITSEDVLHSFYIPAFRTKMDAIPGRYTMSWFEPSKTGEYHIFCAEYCGMKHSHMIGRVVVLDPTRYEEWLKNGGASSVNAGETPEVAGARLFQEQRCVTCHQTNGIMAPVLNGVFGKEVKLQTGQTIVVDETYVRESILNPSAKVVQGYQANMPTYQGQVSEDNIMQLIAYIKSLAGKPEEKPSVGQPEGEGGAPGHGMAPSEQIQPTAPAADASAANEEMHQAGEHSGPMHATPDQEQESANEDAQEAEHPDERADEEQQTERDSAAEPQPAEEQYTM